MASEVENAEDNKNIAFDPIEEGSSFVLQFLEFGLALFQKGLAFPQATFEGQVNRSLEYGKI